MIRARIVYSGTVQGVGFRFTVQRHAARLNLTGWVRNCPDGTVEMTVEGPQETIAALCRDIEEHFQGYISDKDIHYVPPEGQFKNFQIAP